MNQRASNYPQGERYETAVMPVDHVPSKVHPAVVIPPLPISATIHTANYRSHYDDCDDSADGESSSQNVDGRGAFRGMAMQRAPFSHPFVGDSVPRGVSTPVGIHQRSTSIGTDLPPHASGLYCVDRMVGSEGFECDYDISAREYESTDAAGPFPVRSSRSTANTPRVAHCESPESGHPSELDPPAERWGCNEVYRSSLLAQKATQELKSPGLATAANVVEPYGLHRPELTASANLTTPRGPHNKDPRHERNYPQHRIKNRDELRQTPPRIAQPKAPPQTARTTLQSVPKDYKNERNHYPHMVNVPPSDERRNRSGLLVKFLDSLKTSLGLTSTGKMNRRVFPGSPSGLAEQCYPVTSGREMNEQGGMNVTPSGHMVSPLPLVILPPTGGNVYCDPSLLAVHAHPAASPFPISQLAADAANGTKPPDGFSSRSGHSRPRPDQAPAMGVVRMKQIPYTPPTGTIQTARRLTDVTATTNENELPLGAADPPSPTSIGKSLPRLQSDPKVASAATDAAALHTVGLPTSIHKTEAPPAPRNFPVDCNRSVFKRNVTFNWRIAQPLLRMHIQRASTFCVNGVPYDKWEVERIPTLGASPTSCRVQEMFKATIPTTRGQGLRVFIKRIPIGIWAKQYEAQNKWHGEYVTDGENFVMEAAALAFLQEYDHSVAPALLGILEQSDERAEPAMTTIQADSVSRSSEQWQKRQGAWIPQAERSCPVTHMVIVSELYGEDLLDLLDRREKENRPLQPVEKHKLQCECLLLLKRLHKLGFAHLDFTPENVLSGPSGLRLCDFAKATPLWTYKQRHVTPGYGRSSQLANMSSAATWLPFESCEPTVGKGAYMPPECWKVYWQLEETRVQFPLEELWPLQNPHERLPYYFRVCEADVYMLGVLLFWIWSEGGIWRCSDPRQDEKYYHLLKSGLNFDIFRECRAWPHELKDLLQKALRAEPLRRTTLDGLLSHTWVQKFPSLSSTKHPSTPTTPATRVTSSGRSVTTESTTTDNCQSTASSPRAPPTGRGSIKATAVDTQPTSNPKQLQQTVDAAPTTLRHCAESNSTRCAPAAVTNNSAYYHHNNNNNTSSKLSSGSTGRPVN